MYLSGVPLCLRLKKIKKIYYSFLDFWRIQSCKVRVRLKLGFFSNANILKIWFEASPKVRVRLKLGCGLN